MDLAGAVTGATGLGAVVYGITRGWVPVVVGLALLLVFIAVEARFAAAPMMPLRFFRLHGVAVSNTMLLLFGGAAIAMWFFTSLFMQHVLRYSALRAGLGQTPAAVVFVVVARFAAGRFAVPAGCACLVAGFGWLSQAGAGSGYLYGILAPTLLVAAGIGLVFPTLMATATADVPAGDAGVAAGLANTTSQVGGAIALAAFTTVADYGTVFLLAAGISAAIAALSPLLP